LDFTERVRCPRPSLRAPFKTLPRRQDASKSSNRYFLKKISVNQITIPILHLACRQYHQMIKAGISKNNAIRLLEIFEDSYARQYKGGEGRFNVLRAKDIPLWSKAARKYRKGIMSGKLKPKDYVRVEHGTPRRSFADKILALYKKKKLYKKPVNTLVDKKWELAMITLKEDARLNQGFRTMAMKTPRERWHSVGIKF